MSVEYGGDAFFEASMSAPISAILLAVTAPSAATFSDLVDGVQTTGTTAQVVALDAKTSQAAVGSAVSRVLPMVSLSDNLTWTTLNTERFQQDGETAEECAERLGRVCEQLLTLGNSMTIPGETVNHSLSLMGTQTLWSAPSILGIAKAHTRRELSDTQGMLQLDKERSELVQTYVELQAAVENLALTRAMLAIADEDLTATQAARSVGDATDLDVDLAAFEVEKTRLDLTQAERAIPRSLDRLWDTAGRLGERTQRVCPMMEVTDRGGPLPLDAALSLELARLQEQLDRQDRTVARLAYLPTLAAVGGVSWSGRGEDLTTSFDDFAQNSWFIGGTASWTLFSGGSRVFDNATSTRSVQSSVLERAQDERDLVLGDAEYAARLRDLADERDLLDRELDLQRRKLSATTSSYRDGGRAPLDQVLQGRRAVHQLEKQIVSTHQQQVLTATQRWIEAGRTPDMLAAMTASDRHHAAAGHCTELSR